MNADVTTNLAQKKSIAIVYLEGAILKGYSRPDLFGGNDASYSGDIANALRKAAAESSIGAIVLRIDSPGGSAEASEIILDAVKRAQEHKPVVISMGNVAASGGYYVALSGDALFADSMTITGSIGVVGGKLVTRELWNSLGISWHTSQRGANAGILSSSSAFTPEQRALFTQLMQNTYTTFTGHLAAYRGKKLRQPIEKLAGGRVFTGRQALELGLIDYIGGLHDALGHAAELAGLEEFSIRVVPKPLDFMQMLSRQLSGRQNSHPTDISVTSSSTVSSLLSPFQALLPAIKQMDSRKAKSVLNTLLRIALIQREKVVLMPAFDFLINE